MSHFKPLAAAILAITLSCAAYAPAEAGGGRGGGGGSGGGGASYSGGAGMRAGNGQDFDAGAPRFSGGTRADEGPGFDADTRGDAHPSGQHSAGDGARYTGSRFAAPRFAGRALSHGSDGTRLSTIGDGRTNGGNRNMRDLLNSHAMVNDSHDGDAAIAARDDRNEHGSWRHRHGGHGWLGSLFWPFGYDDVYGYATDGDGDGDDRAFWDYGYKDIYARIFPRYSHDHLSADLPPDGATAPERQASRAPADPVELPAAADPATPQARQATPKAIDHPAMPQATADPATSKATARPATAPTTARTATARVMAQPATPQPTAPPATSKTAAQPTMAQATVHPAGQRTQLCSDDSREIAGLPIDQIQQAIAPNAAQLAALDELGNASMKAAQDIRAACPTQILANAPGRLAMTQQRVEAMIAAVLTVRPALDKFYGLLDDGQKARVNGIGPNQRNKLAPQRGGGSLVQDCGTGQAGATNWPIAEIGAKLQLTATQRESLTALVDATAKASDMFKGACQPDAMLTPPARLAAIGNRLDVMLVAIKAVHAALDDFYDRLTDEQKAQFEAIAPGHSAASAGQAAAGEPAAPTRPHPGPGRPRASSGGGAT